MLSCLINQNKNNPWKRRLDQQQQQQHLKEDEDEDKNNTNDRDFSTTTSTDGRTSSSSSNDETNANHPISSRNDDDDDDEKEEVDDDENEDYHNIVRHCMCDPTRSNIHIIPMGLAGELWPFFRPNYQKCAEYVHDVNQQILVSSSSSQSSPEASTTTTSGGSTSSAGDDYCYYYDRVVAFIPTGWANGSKWNREHSISKKLVTLDGTNNGGRSSNCDINLNNNCKTNLLSVLPKQIQVEIRLIPYSEHSSYDELIEFVKYCKPRRIVPTVYSTPTEQRKLIQQYTPYIDSTRAKQALLFKFLSSSSSFNNENNTNKLSSSLTTTTTTTKKKKDITTTSTLHPEAAASSEAAAPTTKVNFKSKVTKVDYSSSSTSLFDQGKETSEIESCLPDNDNNDACGGDSSDDEIEVVGVVASTRCNKSTESFTKIPITQEDAVKSTPRRDKKDGRETSMPDTPPAARNNNDDGGIDQLVDMGFSRIDAERAMKECNGNVRAAIDMLLLGEEPSILTTNGNPSAAPLESTSPTRSEPRSAPTKHKGTTTSKSSSSFKSGDKMDDMVRSHASPAKNDIKNVSPSKKERKNSHGGTSSSITNFFPVISKRTTNRS